MKGVSSGVGHGRLSARPICTRIMSKISYLKFDKPNQVTKSKLFTRIFIC